MAKSLDNTLRTMNEYLNDMFNTFGGASAEYTRALQQVREALPENVLNQTVRKGLHYAGTTPTAPLQFARGKASQQILSNFRGDLDTLRAEQRKTGTAAVQMQDYIQEAKIEQKQTDLKDIKQRAQERYEFNNSVNDWYEDIINDDTLTKAQKQDIKDDYSNIRSDYDDPNFRRGLKEKVTALKAISEQEKAHTAAQAAVAPFSATIKDIIKGL